MKRKGDWIQTFTGRQFWPLDPHPDDVDLIDIAHALAHKCRFGGHCRRFYSVAEHSVLLSHAAPSGMEMWALLHDASEAYWPDLLRPLKRQPECAALNVAETHIMRVIADKVRLPWPMPPRIKDLDHAILADEVAQLLGAPPAPWTPPAPLGVTIHGWSPAEARLAFIERLFALWLREPAKRAIGGEKSNARKS